MTLRRFAFLQPFTRQKAAESSDGLGGFSVFRTQPSQAACVAFRTACRATGPPAAQSPTAAEFGGFWRKPPAPSKHQLVSPTNSAFFCTTLTPVKPPRAHFTSVWRLSHFVGYAQSGLKYGGSLATPQFLYIGANTATPITSIVPTGDDTYNNVAIQTLDAYGYTENNYSWTDAGGEGWDEIGWVDDDNNLVTDVTFEPGQALWVLGSSSSQGLQTSGKVGTSDVQIQLRYGGTLAGNPFPVKITLGDLIPTGEDTYNNVSVQILDAYGYTQTNYSWTDAGGEGWDEIGWVDDDNNLVTNVEIEAGQGLWVLGSNSNQYLRFPAPEL